jgi:CheY-like chemotaxis protein
MRSINILLIEDNEGDIELTKEAFEESKLINKISVIKDGREAIRFFENLKDIADRPHLVFLDINLPKASGHEVLKYIKNSEKHKSIPVIMLTTSSSEKDILQCYNNHVNCYISKPIEMDSYLTTMAKIEDFWINITSTPAK